MATEAESISLTPVFKAKTLEDARQRALQGRALKSLFEPSAIAVIGASRREGSVGHSVFKNLLMNGYTGTLYPINPKNPSIMGVKCHQSVLDIADQRHLALVGTVSEGERQVIIAVGRYHLDPATNWADCAFMVRDDWQDKGVGRYLLSRLIEIAHHRGIEGMSADVLVENTRMMHVFHLCAPGPIQSRFEDGAYHISFSLEPGEHHRA